MAHSRRNDTALVVEDPTNKNGKAYLTRKQKAFCENYVTTRRIKESALSAGYTGKRASQQGNALLIKPEIIAYLTILEVEIKDRNKITQDYFIIKCKDIIEKVYGVKNSDRIAALRLLAQITGHIKETNIDTRQQVTIIKKGVSKEAPTVVPPKKQ